MFTKSVESELRVTAAQMESRTQLIAAKKIFRIPEPEAHGKAFSVKPCQSARRLLKSVVASVTS